ncbi:hypothetical protein Ait01nite_037650 [Actinoplanes italicus]|uniref:PknH-like protein n=1 Tax=Actinoplanes italicus TaxID=113567 RepID=A0A2T0K860_9ACTN|nr:hypothetical protein [Actinoplanes italicus]PRX19265.1 hypothetical protein CLV67_11017 [Actinoplanes italicus]GIE30720.1 hypothetical protein Ait01nite_037650 [Actinoplanes italicus]
MRTTSIRTVTTAGLLAATLTACAAEGSTVTPVSASSSAPVEGAPAVSAPAEGIPAAALLQPADVRDAKPETVEEGEFAHVRPLRPCGGDRYPSDGTRTDAVAKRYVVPGEQEGSTPSVVVQFVGRHTPGGAAEQIGDISAALKRCPGGLGKGEHKWDVVEATAETTVVRIGQRFSYADEEPATVNHYAAVSRVGDAIVVVADLGWENMDGSEPLVRDLITKARERATAIA